MDYDERRRAGKVGLIKGVEKERDDRSYGYSDKTGHGSPFSDEKDRFDVRDIVKYIDKGIADQKESNRERSTKYFYDRRDYQNRLAPRTISSTKLNLPGNTITASNASNPHMKIADSDKRRGYTEEVSKQPKKSSPVWGQRQNKYKVGE